MALEPPRAPSARQLACKACGAPLEIRAPGRSVVVACPSCGAVLDAQDPDARVIARAEMAKGTALPRIPLGTRGTLKGQRWEAIGYMVRRTTIEGITYSWFEYLLFNPYQGFRWLVESQGHWTLAKAAAGVPKGKDGAVVYLDAAYKHFQSSQAEVAYVVGEFPWRVKVGDRAEVADYVQPPLILSREVTGEETTWSIGEYLEGARVWEAFKLEGHPPERIGVGAAQPSPYRAQSPTVFWLLLSLLAAALLVQLVFMVVAQRRIVLDTVWEFQPRLPATHQVVSEPFEITGRRSNVMAEITTSVQNTWIYLTLALVNEGTGASWAFGREVGYYAGRDSDGFWSEGSTWDRAYVPHVPAGRYTLVVEPEGPSPVSYRVRLTRDVPRPLHFWLAAGLLVVPPLFFWWRQWAFELRRWRESDHPMVQASSDGDDDD